MFPFQGLSRNRGGIHRDFFLATLCICLMSLNNCLSGTGNDAANGTGTNNNTNTPPPTSTLTLNLGMAGGGSGTVTSTPPGINCVLSSGVISGTCSLSAPTNTSVTLVFQPSAGSFFSEWGDACSGTTMNAPCTLTLAGNVNIGVTARFDPAPPSTFILTVANGGTGSVTSTPSGINCGSSCSYTFPAGTQVTLTATPQPGFVFSGWSGGGCLGTGPCTVTLTTALTVTATFSLPQNLMLSVSKSGSGTGTVTSAPNGIDCGASCAHAFAAGTLVTLTATPLSGSLFSGWSGGGCLGTGPCTVTLTTALTVTATFVPVQTPPFQFTIIPGSGSGSILCNNAPCGSSYAPGTVLALLAQPGAGYLFDNWGGACSGSIPSCSVTMDTDKTVTANFKKPSLSVILAPAGGGSVSSNPAGIACPPTCLASFNAGSQVILTATVPTGTVVNWAGNCSVSTVTCTVGALTGDATITAMFGTAASYAYPLKLGPTSRYLVDQNNKPYLLVGDAGWSLFVSSTNADAELYLDNRKQKGFNAILVELIENYFASNAPRNIYGEPPFTGRTFTTPNEAYFSRVDAIMSSAAAKGLVVVLAPLYLGFECGVPGATNGGIEGWCTEIMAASDADLRSWGTYVGNRYKNYDNIIWDIGGDADPSPVRSKVQAMVDAILAVDTRHPFLSHNAPDQMGVEAWPGASWLTVNTVYTYRTAFYQDLLAAYAVVPIKPYILFESVYENEQAIAQQALRAQSYWAVLSGGFGHIFGNCPVWGFGEVRSFCNFLIWRDRLDSQGAVNMRHFQALFHSRRWHLLVPDLTIVTAGTGSWGSPDYVLAAAASDGSSIIAYLPTARPITVNAASLIGPTMKAWWYNPANGTAVQAGSSSYPTSTPQSFTPPGGGDWVLVLDSTAFSFTPPGQP